MNSLVLKRQRSSPVRTLRQKFLLVVCALFVRAADNAVVATVERVRKA